MESNDQISGVSMEELVPLIYKLDGSFQSQGPVGIEQFLHRYLSDSSVPWKTVQWNDVLPRFTNNWLNTDRPLNADQFQGKLVVLDFFTYCCINCMHILPYLKRLETSYPNGELLIVGVHSAKFLNEKSSTNVASAISRYEIDHPVINDVDCYLWNNYDIHCWPTVVVFDPNGRLIFWFEGESRMCELEKLIAQLLAYYRDQGNLKSVGAAIDVQSANQIAKSSINDDKLKFPGKLALSPSGRLLAVSDSGHHRIVILDVERTAKPMALIGQKNAGFTDGDLGVAQFRSPQGVCWLDDDTLFVADTENHSIRKIDMVKKLVNTVGGTGIQGHDLVGGKEGKDQEISSPWDVVVAEFQDNAKALIIAAAGTHQIWILPLTSAITIGKRQFEPDRLCCFAGTGAEAARNNSYPHQAAFAQPSGLCIDGTPTTTVYVADSESSSIRGIDMKSGAVKNVVGSDRNPENLFAFGDVDGVGFDAKLQHPLGVGYCKENGRLYVADSYNHKIKEIDPVKRNCSTLTLDFGQLDIIALNEPGGIYAAFPNLYVADTNNHRILAVDVNTGHVKKIDLSNRGVQNRSSANVQIDTVDSSGTVIVVPSNTSSLKLRIRLHKPEELELNQGAPHAWKITQLNPALKFDQSRGELQLVQGEAQLPDLVVNSDLPKGENGVLFKLDLVAYTCNKKSGICAMSKVKFTFVIGPSDDTNDHIVIDWKL